jgi:hypothetical protein
MVTATQITAARRFAPPLVVAARVDRRGAKLRTVNRRAVDYATRAGMRLEDVYPGGLGVVRSMAPGRGSSEAAAFAAAAGLGLGELYPPSTFAGEIPRKRWRWGWMAVGAFVGAALLGPVGAVAGGLIGGTR